MKTTPYYERDGITIYCGDCLDVMADMEPDAIDTIMTDPPYGLEFMGKDWDHGVPGVPFWEAALRVAKPGATLLAFGGTRTHHRLMCAIEDAGWMIRDCIMWVYGCLSDDTEILTVDGWKHHSDLTCGSMVMCYNVGGDKLQWESVQEVFTYAYSDTAYNIRSNSTDQLVSRNHRCLVERGGTYVYKTAERLAGQETVPVLEYLPGVPGDILADSGLVEKSKSGALLEPMQRGHARDGVGKARPQGAGGVDGREPRQLQRENERSEQSGLERRCNIFPQEGQLRRIQDQVRAMSGAIQADGPQGWIHNGTSLACGPGDGATAETLRGGTPQRPQSREQQPGQSGTLCQQQPAQEVRGNGATSPTLATITPVHYDGVVWCVRVPTGAFVARRNGHVFVTGNSGFPKSHNIGKAIDKAAGVEREVVGRENKKAFGYEDRPWKHKEDANVNIITAPATTAAKLWDGWGTALKPAWEPIIVAMKPLDGTFAQNALEHGVAGLWVDGGRVETDDNLDGGRIGSASDGWDRPWKHSKQARAECKVRGKEKVEKAERLGRWPANLILTYPENEYIMKEDLTEEQRREIFQWMQENA